MPIKALQDRMSGQQEAFVGRENELVYLNSTYNDIINTKSSLIYVWGDAGIGKTTLIREFSARLGDEVKNITVECDVNSHNKAYFLISGIVIKSLNLNPGDDLDLIKNRLISFSDYILPDSSVEDRKRITGFISLVLGLERDLEFQNILDSMSFESIKREITRQIFIYLGAFSRKFRTVIVLEDVHWADDPSLVLIKGLISLLDGVGTVFIATSRCCADQLSSWAEMTGFDVHLQPFQGQELFQYCSNLLKVKNIQGNFLTALEKQTGGNPLYIRELIHSAKRKEQFTIQDDTALLKQDVGELFPASIQNLIMTNISELDEAEKLFLEVASVMGNEFELGLVQSILQMHTDDLNLANLTSKTNIIALKSTHIKNGNVQKMYSFMQDIQREAIYESILKSKKREYHQKIGELIETRYTQDLDRYHDDLYQHFYQAEIYDKAFDHAYQSASRQKAQFNLDNALEILMNLLSFLGKDLLIDVKARKYKVLMDIGHTQMLKTHYDEAQNALDQALSISESSGDMNAVKLLLAQIYKEKDQYEESLNVLNDLQNKIMSDSGMYGKLLQMKSEILRITGNSQALAFAKKSEKMLSKAREFSSLAETMNQAGILYFMKGEVDNALFYFNKSLQYAEKVNHLGCIGRVSGNMGIIYHTSGILSKARDSFTKSIDISKKISDLHGVISGSINLGILHMDKGSFDKAEEMMREALKVSQDISSKLNEPIILTNLGDVCVEKGSYDSAREYYERSRTISRDINVPIGEGINILGLVRCLIMKNQMDQLVPQYLQEAYQIINDSGDVFYLNDYYRLKALFEIAAGDIHQAEQTNHNAISYAQESDRKVKKLKAIRQSALIQHLLHHEEEAEKHVNEAIKLSEQMDLEYELAKSWYLYYQILTKQNQVEKAQKTLEFADEYIGKIDECRVKNIIMLRTQLDIMD